MSLIGNARTAKVEVRQEGDEFTLARDGRPFFVKGAGGFEQIGLLVRYGANSVRTWGAEQTELVLPQIRGTGLTLCAGLWLEPPRRGFDYSDVEAVRRQAESLEEQVLRFKDEPGLLIWGVGNELELGGFADAKVWQAVESIAAFIKKVDTLHPVMTVLASAHEDSLRAIERYCPSVDLVGINSYGDLEKVKSALDKMGWKRPYLVTEWGANGSWEVETTRWGAEIEPTSTEKAEQVRRRYRCVARHDGQCLGGYVFLWGSKQETTPTWYGLLSPEGRVTEAVEAIGALWSGEEESGACPRIGPLSLNGVSAANSLVVASGGWVEAAFEILRGELSTGDVDWSIRRESADKGMGGDEEAGQERISVEIEVLRPGRARFAAPNASGAYRVFVEARGPGGTVATANFPFWVE